MLKSSIARKITLRVSAILLVALAVLFIAAYLIVQRIVSSKTRSYNEAALRLYADMISDVSEECGAPVNDDFAETVHATGEYVCDVFQIDFAYLFTPDYGPGKIRYLCVSQSDYYNTVNPTDKYFGKVTEYTLTSDEREVWNGTKKISHSKTVSKHDHELSTMLRFEDKYGNVFMAGVDQSYGAINREIEKLFLTFATIILFVLLITQILIYIVIKKRVSKPAAILSKTMNEFIRDGKHSSEKLFISSNDEFSMISSAFNSMTDNINDYIDNIKVLTNENERQNAELDIASNIQRGLLRASCYEGTSYNIYADMIPARQVGGDFYDYMPLENGKTLTVIADVSGKGISASLFMAITLELIREYAKMNMSPSEILSRINDTLSENNPEYLFLTAIVGIYDETTHTFTYANAGHNLPYVIGNGVRLLDAPGNMILGVFPGEKYTEYTINLSVGDTLFAYTDGVNEATNKDNEFFGTERLEKVLNDYTLAKKNNVIDFVNEAISEFADGAERHDDITMIAFSPANILKLELSANEREFCKIRDVIMGLPILRDDKLSLCLAAEECFVNICNYAYVGEENPGVVNCTISFSNCVTLKFEDTGIPFNPTENMVDVDSYDINTSVGGLGRFIAFENVDHVKYEYSENKNILTLTKFFA